MLNKFKKLYYPELDKGLTRSNFEQTLKTKNESTSEIEETKLTRLENFLAKMAGDSRAKNLVPSSKLEYFLNKIAKKLSSILPIATPTDIGKVLTVNAGKSTVETIDLVPLQTNGVLFGQVSNLENVNTSVSLEEGMTVHVSFDLWDHHLIASVDEDVELENNHSEYCAVVTVLEDYILDINFTTQTVTGVDDSQHENLGEGYSLENFCVTVEASMPGAPEVHWSSSALPAATSADEGKVLSVDSSGEYVLAEQSGGGSEPFVVTLTQPPKSADIVADKTTDEIYAAVQAGKNVYVLWSDSYYAFAGGSISNGTFQNMSFARYARTGSAMVMYWLDPNVGGTGWEEI